MLQDRGVLPKEEGDVVREKAMHEETFQSSWLRKEEGKEERRRRTRRGRNDGCQKKVLPSLFPLRPLIFSVRGKGSESCGNSWEDLLGDSCGLSDCGSEASSGVLVATDVRVSASSTGVVMSESFGFGLCLGSCEAAVFSFSRQRRAVCVENQENMSYEGTPLTAPQASRRKIMPPTLQQSSQSSIEATHWQAEVEDQESGSYEKEFEGEHRWAARERTVIARMEQDLNKNDCMRVAIKELESLLGPEDSEVNLRKILKCAR